MKMTRFNVNDLPALDYDPKKFNSMGGYGESIISGYYDKGQDLVIRYNPHPDTVTVDSLAVKHKV